MTTETIYKHFVIDKLSDISLLANWFRINGQGSGKAVSVALHPKKGAGAISFGTSEEVVTLPLGGEFESAILGVCKTVFIDQGQTDLICRDIYQDLIDLTQLFSKKFKINGEDVFNHLAPLCVGDLRAAANIIGLTTTPKKQLRNSADDAYEVALYETQFSHGIAPYYAKVSLPFARLQAETTLLTTKGKKDWFISYPNPWLRVFAHYTGDPTIHWMFDQGRDVIETIAETLKVTPIQAHALLLWQAHDREVATMMKRFPDMVENLPESLPKHALNIDKHYPTMCANTMQMRQAYIDTRTVHTLYGRRMRPGPTPGEAIAFRIFGSVEDMVAVAAVSLWQNRISAEVRIAGIEGAPNSSQIRINGVGPTAGKEFWKAQVDKIAPLGNPLSILLQPTVVFI